MQTVAHRLIDAYSIIGLHPNYTCFVQAAKLFALMTEAFAEAAKGNKASQDLLGKSKAEVPNLILNADRLLGYLRGLNELTSMD